MNGSPRLALVLAVPALLCSVVMPVRAAGAGIQASPAPVTTPAQASVPAPAPVSTWVAAVPVAAIECPNCGDSDPCTADSCDPLTGFCRHLRLTCDDRDPCTQDYCDPYGPHPGCVNVPLPDGSLCSPERPCVYQGLCVSGACREEPAPEGTSCEEVSPCTGGDLCDGAGTCIPGRPWPVGTPCVGGYGDDPCSDDESCGFDESGAAVCSGTVRSCDDGDPCTTDECGPDRTCLNTPVICYDGNNCTRDSCDPRTGACVSTAAAEGGGCVGPDRCTLSYCAAGNCVGSGTPNPCDDSQPCTRDVCNPAGPFVCDHIPDNSLCSQGGPCDAYICAPTEFGGFQCRGVGPCMLSQCEPGQCDSRGFCISTGGTPGAPCDDGNACTGNDTCGAGCQGTPISCDDGVACTLDLCDPLTGCAHVLVPRACDDGNPCTRDACDTDGTTCAHTRLTGDPCHAGDACTTESVCRDGVCVGDPVDCDDQNNCTDDRCNPFGGCSHTAVVCPDDDNACTAEVCNSLHGCASNPLSGTACAGDDNVCTADVCLVGVCTHPPVDDGKICGGAADPCGLSVCRSGRCASPGGCDDGNLCTRDICLGGGACDHLPQPPDFDCDDGNPCTDDDFCAVTPSGEAVCRGTAKAEPRPRTCGIGACERTIDACVDGVPQACVPGEPAMETCNGIDDDCDGLVDEDRIRAMCTLRPAILVDPPMRTEFAVTCRFRDRCDGNLALPPAGIDGKAVWVSRADRLADPNDNMSLPDLSSASCPDPQRGTAWEKGLIENAPARMTGADTVTFDFSLPHDNDCSTLDGDKTRLLQRLAGTPNGLVLVCVSGQYAGTPWEGCALGLLRRTAVPTLE